MLTLRAIAQAIHPRGAVSDDQNMVTRTKCYLLRDAAGDSRAAAT
jgi:hypothetical protein